MADHLQQFASSQVLSNHESGGLDQPHSVKSASDVRINVADRNGPLYADFSSMTIANEVEVKVPSGSGKQMDGQVPWKVIDFERTAMPLYISRAGRGYHFHVPERPGYQTGVLQQPYTDCAVYAFMNKVDASVAEADSKVHLGVRATKFMDSRHDDGSANRRRQVDPQGAVNPTRATG